MFQFPTPDFSHLKKEDFDYIYEPSEDTFLFLDALEKEIEFLEKLKPLICVEIGSGSGCVITFLAKLMKILRRNCAFFGTDINLRASFATKVTTKRNEVDVEVINCDLLNCLEKRLKGKIDVLLFNPPYVPTSEEEFQTSLSISEKTILSATWSGGINGMEVTSRILPKVKDLLSPGGCFYLVVLEENNPKKIKEFMVTEGFSYSVNKTFG